MLAVEKAYKDMVRSGALLDAEKQEQLKAINTTLADLYLKFNKNLLSATNEFSIVVDDSKELAGLPATSVAVAKSEAENVVLAKASGYSLSMPHHAYPYSSMPTRAHCVRRCTKATLLSPLQESTTTIP